MEDSVLCSDIDATQAVLLREMDDLRRHLFPRYLYLLAATLVTWLIWSCWGSEALSLRDAAWVVLAAAGYLAAHLAERHHRLAEWTLLLGLIAGLTILLWHQPSMVNLAAGGLTILIAGSLLSFPETFLIGAVAYASLVGGAMHIAPGWLSSSKAWSWAAFYLVTLVATQIGQSPTREATHLALEGWVQLRAALDEARGRRGELHRVARALEEATYRIERMNNELTLARYQAEVARANKARFAATVSHELRGPLNLILGFARLMALSPERYGDPLPRTYRADVDTIYASSRHLVSLLDDVLDLSQAEVDRMPLVKEWVDLGEVLIEAETVVRPLAERKGLALRSKHPSEGPVALVDRVRMRQIMLNLLTNAVRFTEQGYVQVTLQEQVGQAIVSVRDTGRGIRREDLPRLFQEFSQLHLGQHESEGSGLGLAISKHLIQLHGGRIWAESEEGLGTTIHFSVPLSDRPPSGTRHIRSRVGTMARQHDLVLVVHPEAAIVRLLARHLQPYQVVGAPGLESLASLVRAYLPRAVVVDIDLAPKARDILATDDLGVPVIGCSMPGLTDQAHAEHALSYLIKPVTHDMLAAALHQVPISGDEMTVLVVDDDPDAVRLLEIMLTEGALPRRVLKAYDGGQALRIMRETRPDLVLMDLIMPGMDGEAVLTQMRTDPALRNVPVVIISARDTAADVATLGTYLDVRCPQPVGIAEGAKRLRALLDTLRPAYLPKVVVP